MLEQECWGVAHGIQSRGGRRGTTSGCARPEVRRAPPQGVCGGAPPATSTVRRGAPHHEPIGFDTDGATGCFADAGAWEPLLALFEKGLIQGDPNLDPEVYEDISDSMYLLRTRDQASDGELVAFATTGDGTYPVWVGRSEAGEVVGVVVLVEGMPELLPEDAVTVAA
ncbi:DUF4241 domain-containing protein [Streptomyces sp. NPDC056105]|uniref:DUF4241 domain-containing protein n=1 Tax=Streptomyces sp. NPDC056105 TaxID=3345714 RepID=UPI0035D9B59F